MLQLLHLEYYIARFMPYSPGHLMMVQEVAKEACTSGHNDNEKGPSNSFTDLCYASLSAINKESVSGLL